MEILAGIVVLLVAAWVYQEDRKDRRETIGAVVEPTLQAPYPGRLHGRFSCPDRAVAVAARNTSLLKHGHTPDYSQADDDNSSSNNTLLGGGPPFGGIYLAGAFDFTFKADGQIDTEKSWISVHSPSQYSVTGGMNPDGSIGMASPAGVNIRGNTRSLVVSEGGMDVDSNGLDPIYNAMRPVDRENLEGNTDGTKVQYVHGVAAGPNIAWEKA